MQTRVVLRGGPITVGDISDGDSVTYNISSETASGEGLDVSESTPGGSESISTLIAETRSNSRDSNYSISMSSLIVFTSYNLGFASLNLGSMNSIQSKVSYNNIALLRDDELVQPPTIK